MESFKKVETADGSFTLYNAAFGESYHSVSAGALEESLKKFLLPSNLLWKAQSQREIYLLEVGFGLGYNLSVTAVKLKEVNPKLKLHYFGLDYRIVPLIRDLKLPPPYGEFYEKLKGELLEGGKTTFEVENVRVTILLGDARKKVQELKGLNFDAVYHDAFSPKRNTELWTLEFLKLLKELMKGDAFWVSYSTALPVRRALWELGFKIFNTQPVGRKSPGTAATLEGIPLSNRVYPLSEKEIQKLLNSPKAVPYRDPCLCLPREKILEDYLRRVNSA